MKKTSKKGFCLNRYTQQPLVPSTHGGVCTLLRTLRKKAHARLRVACYAQCCVLRVAWHLNTFPVPVTKTQAILVNNNDVNITC